MAAAVRTHSGPSTATQETSDATAAANAPAEPPTVATTNTKCFFCGYNKHPRNKFPAKDASCNVCSKKGHFTKVSKSSASKSTSAVMPPVATVSAASPFVSQHFVKSHNLKLSPSTSKVSMASTSFTMKAQGDCLVEPLHGGCVYRNMKLTALQDLCADCDEDTTSCDNTFVSRFPMMITPLPPLEGGVPKEGRHHLSKFSPFVAL